MLRIENGRTKFYQWDTDQRLIVEHDNVLDVHFSNAVTSPALVCEVYEENGERYVNVPNILLQQPWAIQAYGCCEINVRTEAAFEVVRRERPADYVYTETEIKKYSDLDERIKALEENPAAVEVDATLKIPGRAADAAATGKAIEAAVEQGKRMVVELTPDGIGGYKANKTYAEIKEAIDAGRVVELLSSDTFYKYYFSRCGREVDGLDFIQFEDPCTEPYESGYRLKERARLYSDNSISIRKTILGKLTIDVNGVEYVYSGNGSQRVSIEIPEPPDDAHIESVAKQLVTWENLPDKPFGGSTRTLIFPSTALSLGEGMGIAPIAETLNLEVGKSYIVTWNGTEYVCEAVEKEFEGIQAVWLGNLPALTGEGEPTDDPFIIGALPAGNDLGVRGFVVPSDGSETFVLKIEGTDGTIKTLDPKYLPSNLTVEQKAEARENIGAASAEDIPDVSGFASKDDIPDVSSFASKDDIPDVSGFTTMTAVEAKGYQTEAQVNTLISTALGVIENGTY